MPSASRVKLALLEPERTQIMSIRYQVNYTDVTDTGQIEAGNPATSSIGLQVDTASGHLRGIHDGKQIAWIDVYYASLDKAPFVLKCTSPTGQTPTIERVAVDAIVRAGAAGSVGQGTLSSWGTSPTGTFDIQFSAPGTAEGSVSWEFNAGTSTPPLKLKIVVRREP